jgi:hypothetical protein
MKFFKAITHMLALALLIVAFTATLGAQSITQGNVLGTVSDPTGAVIPNATVTLKNNNTGATLTRTTNNSGFYEFSLLSPGSYTLTVTAPSYQGVNQTLTATVGQVTTGNVRLAVATAAQTVEVSSEGSIVQTTSTSVSTTMSNKQIESVPNGGGDLSYIAQTAPGASMNTQAGYGNFSTYGLPATSNNFTVNSQPENDPFLSLNNSGATNILLGQNDIEEATVVNNGYSGQYSQAGANVNYVSRAGGNNFHGNAIWRWNGTSLNGNGYFNKQNDPATPRGFVNDNQWAASFGGPIKKNKTFFFVDTEGLRLIVPVSRTVNVPTQQFQDAVLANIATAQPGELSAYQSMFGTYNHAPGASAAANTLHNGGCTADFVGTLGFGPNQPCALQYFSTVKGSTHEWLLSGRLDHSFSDTDKIFGHYRMDRGLQATYTDPLDPIFDVTSVQPIYEGQLQWTHTIGTSAVNSLSINGSHSSAVFVQPNLQATLNLQPVELAFSGGWLYSLGRGYTTFPQGRNNTQYGFVDDLGWTMGKHSLKFGANYSRYDITDFDPGFGLLPAVTGETTTDFFEGNGSNFVQSFPARATQPIALYNLGFYGEDRIRVKKNLNLTFSLRNDYNSNPVCQTNCFNRLVDDFAKIDHGINTPYNQVIKSGLHQALPDSYHAWNWQPRFGFSYAPGSHNTVISGGFGLFTSNIPAAFVDNLMNNLPGDPGFTFSGLPFVKDVAGSGPATALAAANALRAGFANGATLASLSADVPGFGAPNFFNVANDMHSPRFQEWNLQVEQAIGTKTSVSLKYVGNHGLFEQINNTGLNAFSPSGTDAFAGLPAAPTDPRFLQITEASSGYTSNYNGMTASVSRRLSSLQFQINYTWSHALDFVSNAGNPLPYNFNTNTSIISPVNPFNVRQNMYGNADYDVRQNFTANYVYTSPKFSGWRTAASNWTVAGTLFAHTGLPFTVVDSNEGALLNGFGYGGANGNGVVFANQTGGGIVNCGSEFAKLNSVPCPGLANNFGPATGFGTQRRNQAYGPKYFDTDLTLKKAFALPHLGEKTNLSFGVTFYNLFNHPNFDQPDGDVASPTFGKIVSTVNSPTSIYGSFLNADAAPRLIQTELKLSF